MPSAPLTPERRAYLIAAAKEAQPYPPEAALAGAWLQANIDDYNDIDFQKRVGVGLQLGGDYDVGVQKMAAQATRKRVDLVAYSDTGATLIELKDHADLAAIRQAANYSALWRIAPTTPAVVAVLVVANSGDPDIVEIGQEYGVRVELLTPG